MSKKRWFWFTFTHVLSLAFAADALLVPRPYPYFVQDVLGALLFCLLATASVSSSHGRNAVIFSCIIGADLMSATAAYFSQSQMIWGVLIGLVLFAGTAILHVRQTHSKESIR